MQNFILIIFIFLLGLQASEYFLKISLIKIVREVFPNRIKCKNILLNKKILHMLIGTILSTFSIMIIIIICFTTGESVTMLYLSLCAALILGMMQFLIIKPTHIKKIIIIQNKLKSLKFAIKNKTGLVMLKTIKTIKIISCIILVLALIIYRY